MIVRPFDPSDEGEFRAIHAASGLDYRFPDLSSPLFIVKTVVERAGRPRTLLAGRIEVEAYLMTSGSAQERLDDIQMAQAVFLEELWKQGIDSAYCTVPPRVERHFGKHMTALGWQKTRPWPIWSRETGYTEGI